MSFASGSRLGPYEIQTALGAGGMGEVYKATDARLDRTVALKVLLAALAADPEFRERFAREAKSISALSHPNICTLFDVGEAPAASGQPPARSPETVHYLVMEYLEGETLGTRLERGALPLSGEKKPSLFLQTPFNEDKAVFSPDGHWVAYDSNEYGTTEIYVRPFPVASGQSFYQVSRRGGVQPLWSDDGRELFFLAPDGTLMSASISAASGFQAGPPKALCPTGVTFTGNRRLYAVAKDGKRFLIIVPEQRMNSSPITVVVNWPERLREGMR